LHTKKARTLSSIVATPDPASLAPGERMVRCHNAIANNAFELDEPLILAKIFLI
jgi:hypothetical protein